MYGQCIGSTDRQLISEDTFLWLSRENLKGETERSGTGTKNIMQQKYYKQKQQMHTMIIFDETVEDIMSSGKRTIHKEAWQSVCSTTL